MTAQELTRYSKTISYPLRHDPISFGLSLSDDGSVPVDDLFEGISKAKYRTFTENDLDMPGKKHFIIEDGMIRAYYGHAVDCEDYYETDKEDLADIQKKSTEDLTTDDLGEYLEGLIPHEELENLVLDSVISLLKDVGRVTIGGFAGHSDFPLLFLCDI